MCSSDLLQIKHYETIENYVKKTRVVVHDTKHHLLALDALLAHDQFDEAKAYIKSLEVDLFALEKFKVCDNKLVDAIMQSVIASCQQKGIALDYRLTIPEPLPLKNADVAIIFGNLLSNAIEACDQLTDTMQAKYIDISAAILNDNLTVKIVNPFNGSLYTSKGRFKTTKANKLEHGIGLLSVQNTIDKYQGTIQFNRTDTTFQVIFMIHLKALE